MKRETGTINTGCAEPDYGGYDDRPWNKQSMEGYVCSDEACTILPS